MAELFEDTDFAYQLQLTEALAASSRETSVHDEVVDEQIAWELALQEVKEEAKRTEQTKYVEERDKTLALELALEELSVHAPSTSTAAAYLSDLYRRQQPDELRITCDICLDAKPASSFLMLEACQHMFCGECTSNYVEAQVKISRVPVVCPQEGCYHFLGDDDFSQLTLPPPILESLTKQEVVASIPETERFYCPFPDCSALMAKPENDASTKSRRLSALRMLGVSWFDEEPRGIGSVECFSCHRLFCAECRVPWHNGYTCKQFQKMTPEDFKMAEDDQAFKDLVKAKKWMRCSKCNSIVERSQGCNHMTCRCRYQFCYRCGRDWQICLVDDRAMVGMPENQELPPETLNYVLQASACKAPENGESVAGFDFNKGLDYSGLLQGMYHTGFQATNLGRAVAEVNRMLDWRLSDEPVAEDSSEVDRDPAYRAGVRCKVFLGCTSNLISSGVRETIRYLVEHKLVDVLVTTAGGIEEDLIKCLAPTYMGDFALPGAQLRAKGLNRIGNLLVPNDNYCKFEDWVMPILDKLVIEQKEQGVVWTPSRVIARLGREIDNPSSILYWAQRNGIPVYCPALTDGSLGDMIYFHSYRTPGLVIDIVQDIVRMNSEAVHATPRKTGIIVLGGGLPKHHICNANLMRNGADFSVFINTAQEYDGSDSGASPDEAISWGKIRGTAKPVKVHCDATIAFPLLVAQTFVPRVIQQEGHHASNPES